MNAVKLSGVTTRTLDEALTTLETAARGLVTLPRGKGFSRFRPVRLRGGATLSDAVIEDRR